MVGRPGRLGGRTRTGPSTAGSAGHHHRMKSQRRRRRRRRESRLWPMARADNGRRRQRRRRQACWLTWRRCAPSLRHQNHPTPNPQHPAPNTQSPPAGGIASGTNGARPDLLPPVAAPAFAPCLPLCLFLCLAPAFPAMMWMIRSTPAVELLRTTRRHDYRPGARGVGGRSRQRGETLSFPHVPTAFASKTVPFLAAPRRCSASWPRTAAGLWRAGHDPPTCSVFVPPTRLVGRGGAGRGACQKEGAWHGARMTFKIDF